MTTVIPIYPKRGCFVRLCHTYKRVLYFLKKRVKIKPFNENNI